jgi:hypothetical protein
MVSTRDQAAQNAQQIIGDVFNFSANSPLEKALMENDVLDVTDWTMLTVANLESLTYTDNGAKKHLSLGQWNKIRQFQMYVLNERAKGSPASYDVEDVVFDKFDLFHRSNECIRLMMTSQPIAPISCLMLS